MSSDRSSLNVSSETVSAVGGAIMASRESSNSSRSSSRKSSKVRSTTVKEAVRKIPKPKPIMPPVPPHQPARSSQDVEMIPSPPAGGSHQSTTQVLNMHNDRTVSSTTQVLHQHDNRTQSIHLGISHQEFGSVIAEAQWLLDDSRARVDHFEGIAQAIHNQACEQIVHLKGMVFECLYQSCQSKDMTISGLSNDLSALQNEVLLVRGQLEAQVNKCSTSERIIGHKDREIQRLMNEVSSSQQSLALSHEVRQQLEERLAALSATDNQEKRQVVATRPQSGGYACVQSGENQSVVPTSSSRMTQCKVRFWKLFRP